MAERKPWSVFVYFVADDQVGSPANSLDDVAEDELDLMYDAVDSRNMHLAVQVDYRHKRRVWRHLSRRPDTSLPESSAADPKTVRRFFEWCFESCPADRYVVLFWGHAFGTAGLFPDSRPGSPGSRDLLSIKELAAILSDVTQTYADRPFDALLFKNCCLSNLETAYQLHGCSEVMIASQARLPARGWPYGGMFEALRNGADIEKVGRQMARHLSNFYAEEYPKRDVPVSLLRLDAARRLKSPMADLVNELRLQRESSKGRWESVGKTALRRAAIAGDPALPDVAALCRHLRTPDGPYERRLSEAAQAVEHVVTRKLVLAHHSKTSAFSGLGVFYRDPDAIARSQSIVADVTDLDEYRRLAFCLDTDWNEVAIEPQATTTRQIHDTLQSARFLEVRNAR